MGVFVTFEQKKIFNKKFNLEVEKKKILIGVTFLPSLCVKMLRSGYGFRTKL